MATYVKKKMDEEFGGTWHCVVGRNFGCSITHDTKYVLFFQVDQMHVLLFKSHEQIVYYIMDLLLSCCIYNCNEEKG